MCVVPATCAPVWRDAQGSVDDAVPVANWFGAAGTSTSTRAFPPADSMPGIGRRIAASSRSISGISPTAMSSRLISPADFHGRTSIEANVWAVGHRLQFVAIQCS